tara:strand:+ start:1628 stop:1843 length:216 start_codon:yes stop_codon:yes gene_type:complete
MTDDLPCAQDHFREGLVSLMALAHQQMEPQEVVFFGIAALTSYCYTMAPNDDVAQRTIDAAIETGKEDYES